MAITAYGILLAPVTSLQYLRRVLFLADNEWALVVSNLWRPRHKWARLTRVLSRDGADERTSGQIYLAVVKLVMFYGSDTWVVTYHIGRFLGGFYHRVAHRLRGRQHWQERDGVCVYPPTGGRDSRGNTSGSGDLRLPPS